VFDNPEIFDAGALLFNIAVDMPAIDDIRSPAQGNNYLLPGFISFGLRCTGNADVDNFAVYELDTAPAFIPEPVSAAMLLIGGALLLRHGRVRIR
jgi:hypothetical protein